LQDQSQDRDARLVSLTSLVYRAELLNVYLEEPIPLQGLKKDIEDLKVVQVFVLRREQMENEIAAMRPSLDPATRKSIDDKLAAVRLAWHKYEREHDSYRFKIEVWKLGDLIETVQSQGGVDKLSEKPVVSTSNPTISDVGKAKGRRAE